MGANGSEPSDDAVFKALADATRRDLLDALYAVDGQTLGQLAARHPHLTRFGVMKHLAVLEDAGLIVAEKVGREKRHYLNPVPIAQIAGRWISRYARPFTTALVGLKAGLELADSAVPADGVDSAGSSPTGSTPTETTPTGSTPTGSTPTGSTPTGFDPTLPSPSTMRSPDDDCAHLSGVYPGADRAGLCRAD